MRRQEREALEPGARNRQEHGAGEQEGETPEPGGTEAETVFAACT